MSKTAKLGLCVPRGASALTLIPTTAKAHSEIEAQNWREDMVELPLHRSANMRSAIQTAPETKFSDWTCLRYHLGWAYEGGVWPAARVGSYSNMSTSCWLVRRGSVTVTTAGRKTKAGPGQWVFVASPSRHQEFSEDARILSIHFDFTWPGGEQVIQRPKNLMLDAADFPELEETASKITRMVAREFPHAHAFLMREACTMEQFLRVQNLLPAWLAAYLEALASLGIRPHRAGVQDERILRALSWLDHYPFTQSFSAAGLVAHSGLSRSRLDALFVEAIGITPRAYLDRRRLDEASKLLLHTTSSIKEIALGLGFRHSSHFSLWFRRHRKTSPQDFRASREPSRETKSPKGTQRD